MLRKPCIIVLFALTLMSLASPAFQFESLDSFPVSSDDFELSLVFCFSLAGMVLLFAHVIRLIKVYSVAVPLPLSVSSTTMIEEETRICEPMLFCVPGPLRI